MYNLYLICAEFEGRRLYKIGYTKRPIEKRIKEIKTANGHDIYLIESFQSKWGTKIEPLLHKRFISKQVNREWFDLDFEDVDSFLTKCKSLHDMFESLTIDNTYFQLTGRFY